MTPRTRYVLPSLALLAVALAYTVTQGTPARPAPPRPIPSARPSAPPARPLTAADVLARADVLGLDARQRARLDALAREWQRQSAPLETSVRAANDEFTKYMADAQGRGAVRLAELEDRSQNVRRLGAELRELQDRHAAAAAAVLTEAQRSRLPRTAAKTIEKETR